MVVKIGQCYIAKFSKVEMPVRIESQNENGIWLSRSLTHGRIVFVRKESQLIRECAESDLSEVAKTVAPNRRSKKQKQQLTPAQQLLTETPVAARVRKAKPKRPSVPEYSLNGLDAAHRVLKESRKPMTSQEIVDRAIQRKFWRTAGATPQNTLNSAIIRDLKAKGDQSRFVKVGRGLFAAR